MSSVMDIITAQNNAKMEEKKEEGKEVKAETKVPRAIPTPVRSPVFPRRKSADEVVFKCVRATLGFFYATGQRAQFEHGYLVTKDPEVIKYIKAQLGGIASIAEEGPLNKKGD